MMVQTVKCDICGHESKDSKGWLYGFAAPNVGIMISIYNEPDLSQTHMCGHECALKYTNRFLSSIGLDDSRTKNNNLTK